MKSRAFTGGKRWLRSRRTLSTILSVALLSGTFVFVDQSSNLNSAKASATIAASNATLDATGTKVTITYTSTTGALGTTTALPTAFSIAGAGSPVTVNDVAVSNLTIVLTLNKPIEKGKTVTVSYVAPTSDPATSNNAIQDSAGVDAVSFSAKAITNNSAIPALSSITAIAAAGTSIVLNYASATLITTATNATYTAPASAFKVLNGGVEIAVSSVTTTATAVTLTLASPVGQGKTVVVEYTAPAIQSPVTTTNAAIQDTSGNDAISFSTTTTTVTVTNNSTVDQTAPAFSSAAVPAAGNQVTVTYTDTNALASTAAQLPTPAMFDVTANGNSISVSSVTLSTKTYTLNLASLIDSNDVVKVTYNAPTDVAGTGNAAIQDATGNDAPSVTNQAVTNGSSVPALTAIDVDTTGKIITLTYSEAMSSTVPATSAFTVTNNGNAITPSAVALGTNTSTIVITLPTAIGAGRTANLGYTAPAVNNAVAAGAIQDAAGYDALAIPSSTTPISITNGSTVDQGGPVIVSGESSGTTTANDNKFLLTFDRNLACGTSAVPLLSQFAFTLNGSATSPTTIACSAKTLTFTYGSTTAMIGTGWPISVTYTPPTVNDAATDAAVQDASGFNGAGFTISTSAGTFTNKSTTDLTRPVLNTAEVNSAGTALLLTFNETMSGTLAYNTAFSVQVNGTTVTVGTPTASTPFTVEALTALGLTGVTTENIVQFATMLITTPSAGADTVAELQTIVTTVAAAQLAAVALIKNYTGEGTTAPTATDFLAAGVNFGSAQVTPDLMNFINGFLEIIPADSSDSLAEIQAIVDAALAIRAGADGIANRNVNLTAAQYQLLGFTDVETDADAAAKNIIIDSMNLSTFTGIDSPVIANVYGSDTSLTLNVTPPVVPAGVVVDHYVYTVSRSGTTIWTDYQDAGSDPSALQVEGLVNKTAYNVKVRAVTAVGPSRVSAPKPGTPSAVYVDRPSTADNPDTTSLSDNRSLNGTFGVVNFSDGSGFDIDKKGNLRVHMRSYYLMSTKGTVKATYKVGNKKVTWTCNVTPFGNVKKMKSMPKKRMVTLQKKPCVMPKALIAAMKLGPVTVRANLKVSRFYPLTAKPVITYKGKKKVFKPLTRKLNLKMGKLR